MTERIVLYAEDGRILTNGTVYGKVIFLADGEKTEAYHEISEEEYNEIKEREADCLIGDTNG